MDMINVREKIVCINNIKPSTSRLSQFDMEIVNMIWKDEESFKDFYKRVADRLYKWIGTELECRVVEVIGGSSMSFYYRTGESEHSENYYVYEVDREGNRKRIC